MGADWLGNKVKILGVLQLKYIYTSSYIVNKRWLEWDKSQACLKKWSWQMTSSSSIFKPCHFSPHTKALASKVFLYSLFLLIIWKYQVCIPEVRKYFYSVPVAWWYTYILLTGWPREIATTFYYFIKNPQTIIVLTFLTYIISTRGGVFQQAQCGDWITVKCSEVR